MRQALAVMMFASAALFLGGCEHAKDAAESHADAVRDHVAGDERGGSVEAGEENASEKVRVAAEIAAAIEARPDDAAGILASHGMTEDSFESLMYEIAADPALSAAYESARGP